MYFDFQDQHPDIERVGSVLSWRSGALLSLTLHALLIIFVAVGAPAVLSDLMAVTPAAQVVEQPRVPEREMRFFFPEPPKDVLSRKPPPTTAPFSDEHRLARTIERPPDAKSPMPFSRGNSPEPVYRDASEVARGRGPEPTPSVEAQPATPAPPGPDDAAAAARKVPIPESQNARNEAPRSLPDAGRARSSLPGGSLGDALRNLDRYVQSETFGNPRGGQTQFDSFLQFDTYGVDFGSWVRRFKAQVERNWWPLIPQAAMFNHGRVVLTFNVHRNGAISDVAILAPSSVAGFTTAAFGAITSSNPTVPLPAEYPVDKAFFTVTFYYNERPPD
jgi:outer membrane biosynthesis protein TonB